MPAKPYPILRQVPNSDDGAKAIQKKTGTAIRKNPSLMAIKI